MMKIDAVAIGKKLRDLRGNRSQQEVADAVGVTKMAISQYEQGERIPKDVIKIALASYFGQSVEKIFFTSEVN